MYRVLAFHNRNKYVNKLHTKQQYSEDMQVQIKQGTFQLQRLFNVECNNLKGH